MIRDKRALVRMLEAIIAIIILLGFFIFVMSKQREKPNIAEDIYNLERKILTEVSDNMTLREAVLSEEKTSVESFIANRLSAHPALNFNISICNPAEECKFPGEKPLADIYVDDRIIADITQPKVLRLFVWIGAPRKVAPPVVEEKCGNGIIEAGEDCDNGTENGVLCTAPYGGSCTYCNPTCTIEIVQGPYCGDGTVNGPEECEAGQTKVCWTYSDSIPYCEANEEQTGPIPGACVFNSTSHPEILCKKGTKACITSTCAWDSCEGEVWPVEESGWGSPGCINDIDDDCDGKCDDHLDACWPGSEKDPDC